MHSPMDMPDQLGKYHILDVIGRGAMGILCTAYDPLDDNDVAIKVLSLEDDSDPEVSAQAEKQFFKEARIARQLNHPNIVRILDSGNDQGYPYIVMDYIQGGKTIAPFCEKDKLLPMQSVAQLTYTIANTLDYVHCAGVVHRDIKPTNIMLTPQGDVKIADFGIARHLSEKTTNKFVLATPRFMSPEQACGKHVTNQTDLYSLGAIAFEMLVGRPLFESKTLAGILDKTIHEPPPKLRTLRPDAPEGLEIVLDTALQKDPRHRYKHGREFASDLLTVFEGIESESKPALEEQLQLLRDVTCLNPLADHELREVITRGRWDTYGPGDNITATTQADTSLFVLVAGEISCIKDGVVVTDIGKNQCFGILNVQTDVQAKTSIVAKQPATVLELTGDVFDTLSDPSRRLLYDNLLRSLVQRLG